MDLWTYPCIFIVVILSTIILLFIGWHYGTVANQEIWQKCDYQFDKLDAVLTEMINYLADNANRRDDELSDRRQQSLTEQNLLEQFESVKKLFHASQDRTPRVLTRRVKKPDRLQITPKGQTYHSALK